MQTRLQIAVAVFAMSSSIAFAQVVEPVSSMPGSPALDSGSGGAGEVAAPVSTGGTTAPAQSMPPLGSTPSQSLPPVPANPFVDAHTGAAPSAFSEAHPPVFEAHPRPRSVAKPPPAHINAKSGVNTIFGIAQGHMNRIVTPFHSPMVQTSSSADAVKVSVDKNIVYVATGSPEPVGLFIYAEQDPVSAISVTLVPSDIPPVSVDIALTDAKPLPPGSNMDRKGDHAAARSWETQQPYIETLTHAFKDLAQGKIPDGYSLESIASWPSALPRCQPPGLVTSPRQSLTGFNTQIIVALARNDSGRRLKPDLTGPGCAGLAIQAVTTWPVTVLEPGEKTELYISYRRPSEDANDSLRPSLIGGGVR